MTPARLDIVEAWWRERRGVLVDVEEVLPYVVLYRPPGEFCAAPTPLYLGARSFQSALLGSFDAPDLRMAIDDTSADYRLRIVEKHREVVASGKPDIQHGVFQHRHLRGGAAFDYVAGVFPVKTGAGARLLMTYSAPVALS